MTASSQDLRFRPAAADDISRVARLWTEAFPGRRTVEERMRMLETGGRYGGIETTVVASDRDDGLLGACKLYRFEQYMFGAPLPMMGLAAVAVPSEHRRRGIGAALCRQALRIARERGDVLSTLYPFRPDYYERLGWGLVGALHDHRFRTDALPAYPEARHVRAVRDDDGPALGACYERVARRSQGPISRDATAWAYRLMGEEIGVRPPDEAGLRPTHRDPRQHAVVYQGPGDDVTGYALLREVRTRGGREAGVHVRELVAESEAAFRGLLGHLAGQADRWTTGRHFARPEERFGDRLLDPRPPRHRPARSLWFPTERLVRGPMLRVLDVPEALRRRRWYDGEGGLGPAAVIRIELADPQLPENQGPWAVRVAADGSAEVVEEGSSPGPPAGGRLAAEGHPTAILDTDASTFARIYAGELAPTVAARLGHAHVSGAVPLLDRTFATRERFWLLDEF